MTTKTLHIGTAAAYVKHATWVATTSIAPTTKSFVSAVKAEYQAKDRELEVKRAAIALARQRIASQPAAPVAAPMVSGPALVVTP